MFGGARKRYLWKHHLEDARLMMRDPQLSFRNLMQGFDSTLQANFNNCWQEQQGLQDPGGGGKRL